VWEASVQDWEWVLGVNLWGTIHGVRAFVPRMLEAAAGDPGYRGHVVNTASVAGLVDPPLTGPYNVAKHAVVSLSETLYQDLSLVGDRVGCSVLCPSWVGTGIARADRNRDPRAVRTRTRAAAVGQALVDKAVSSARTTAADVARLVFEAIAERRFWILPHPQALDAVRARHEALLARAPPPDPYAALPQLRSQILHAMHATAATGASMDLNFRPEELACGDEVRAAAAADLPDDAPGGVGRGDEGQVADDVRRGQKILHAHGWGAVMWPRE